MDSLLDEAQPASEQGDVLWSIRETSMDKDGLRRSKICHALLKAIQEKEPIHQIPTATQYYVAILSTLASNLISKNPDLTLSADLLHLLSKVLPEVPQAVLRLDSEASLTSIASATSKSANLGLRSGLRCLGVLLSGQAKEVWQRPVFVRAISVLFNKLSDDNAKVRKAAQEAVLEMLSRRKDNVGLDHCFEVLKASFSLSKAAQNERTVLRSLHFSRSVFPLFANVSGGKRYFATLAELLLGLIERQSSSSVLEQALSTLDVLVLNSGEEDCAFVLDRILAISTSLPVVHLGKCVQTIICSKNQVEGLNSSLKVILDLFFRESLKEEDAVGLGSSLFELCTVSALPEQVNGIVSDFASVGLHPQCEKYWPQIIPACTQFLCSNGDELEDSTLVEICSKAVTARASLVDWTSGEEKHDAPWRLLLNEMLSVCADVLGPKKFFDAFPLHSKNSETLVVDSSRLFLFPILQDAWSHPSNDLVLLSVFDSYLLQLAKFSEESAANADQEGLEMNSKILKTRAKQLWAFLPSFCAGASDFSQIFPKKLEKKFLVALRDTELCPIICKAFTAVIQSCFDQDFVDSFGSANAEDLVSKSGGGTLARGDDDDEEEELDQVEDEDDEKNKNNNAQLVQRKPSRVKSEIERENDLNCLRASEEKFLPPLLNMYDSAFRKDSSGAKVQALHKVLVWYFRVSSESFKEDLFGKVMKLLLESVIKSDFSTSRVLFAVSSALAPSLTGDQLDILLRAIKPQLTADSEEPVQKRAYVVLMTMMKCHPSWVETNFSQLVELLQTSITHSKNASSKSYLLHCLEHLNPPDLAKFCSEMLGEVILSLKESNSKTRTAAFSLFTILANKMRDEGKLGDFFAMTVAGLATTTPHFKSATVVACTRLVSVFGNTSEHADLCVGVIKACLDIFGVDKSREIARSCISLCKAVCVRLELSCLQEKVIHQLLSVLLPWSLDTRNRFATLIRVIFDKLIKRVGLEFIEELGVIPQDHRILSYLKRQSSYLKRKKSANRESRNDNEDSTAGRQRQNKVKGGDDPVDLLDASSLGNLLASRKRQHREEDDDKDDFKRDSKGKIIIPDDEESGRGRGKKRVKDDDGDDENSEEEEEPEKTETKNVSKKAKKQKVEQTFGKEFKAKKAGGDAKYKGAKMDPYAYIPLDPRLMGKRKKREAVERFQGIGRTRNRGNKKRQ